MKWTLLLILAALASCSAFNDDPDRTLQNLAVAEREAAFTLTRTVHNWYTVEDDPNVADFYPMFGAGRASKTDSVVATE